MELGLYVRVCHSKISNPTHPSIFHFYLCCGNINFHKFVNPWNPCTCTSELRLSKPAIITNQNHKVSIQKTRTLTLVVWIWCDSPQGPTWTLRDSVFPLLGYCSHIIFYQPYTNDLGTRPKCLENKSQDGSWNLVIPPYFLLWLNKISKSCPVTLRLQCRSTSQ